MNRALSAGETENVTCLAASKSVGTKVTDAQCAMLNAVRLSALPVALRLP